MPELMIICGTGSVNTGITNAIKEGARGAGVGVSIKKVGTSTPFDIINAGGVASGSATYSGAAVPSVINYIKAMADLFLKGRIRAASGSNGWVEQQLIS